MALYLWAIGHDVDPNDMDPIAPQPRSPGTQAVVRTIAPNMVRHETGLWIPLRWNTLSVAQYQALLEQVGLDDALEADISCQVPNFELNFTSYNGKAIRPEQGADIRRDGHWLKDITILIVSLELQA